MFELRKNQVEPVRVGIEFFKQKKPRPSLIVAPVGFGKAIVQAHIAQAIRSSGKTLILQPSKELLEQNLSKLEALGGSASVFSASMGKKDFGDVTYATIQTIKELGEQFKEQGYRYVIVDEADRYPRDADSMFHKFLKASGIVPVLGLTASPFKLQTNSLNMEKYSLTKMLTSLSKHGNFFKDIIHVTQIQDIIKDGFWSKLVYEKGTFDRSELIYNSIKAEYTEESLSDAYENQDVEGKIIDRINETDRKAILVFVPSVHQAIDLAEKIPNAVAIHGKMSKKSRAEAVNGFRSGKIRVAVNVGVLGIGFDYPEIDCIMQGRATASLSVYYQQIGRGVRIHPDKKDCLICDFVDNSSKFGKIDHLYFRKVKKWRLYGENARLLSDTPIDQIGEKKQNTYVPDSVSSGKDKFANFNKLHIKN